MPREGGASSTPRPRGSITDVSGILGRPPHPSRRQRHVDMGDAVFRQRVDHRVDDADEAAGAAGFAAAFVPSGLDFAGEGWSPTSIGGMSSARGSA